MLLLVTDTSGKHGFVGLRKSDIESFIVISGPGSFTGLRVGLAAIKALAEILQKPIVPISLLEVVARSLVLAAGQPSHPAELRYMVALDAGRGEAFVGHYRMFFAGNRVDSFHCESESLLPIQSLAELVHSGATPYVFTPDVALADTLREKLDLVQKKAILTQDRPGSAEVARIGYQKLQAGEIVPAEQLEANYIRRSDAEIFSKPIS
jgi:tRNA threonylcarbamoyladenosine biosynthesis protein TsaB